MSDINEMLKNIRKQLKEIKDTVNTDVKAHVDDLIKEAEDVADAVNISINGKVLTKKIKKGEKTKADRIIEMAPFLSEESLHSVVEEFIDGDLQLDMAALLPFLEDEDIELLVKKVDECGEETFKGLSLTDLMPFAEDDCVTKLFLNKLKKGEVDSSLLPFLDDDALHEVVMSYCRGEIDLDLNEIYPFLEEEDMDALAKAYIIKGGRIDAGMYPFMGEESLHELVVDYCNNENSNIDIDSIYPFLDEKDLNLLFKAYLGKK